ncbi:hypothetical protein C0431_11190 [bacterium]|nr:hypothetical protein [bacterium]
MDQVIGTGSVNVSANQIVIDLPGDYSNRNCLAVSSSYGAPPSPMEEFFADATGVDLPRGNIGAALASTVFMTNTTSLTIYFPNIGKLIEDALGLAGYLGRRRLNMPRCGIDGVRLDGSHRLLPRTDDINKDGKFDFDGPGLIRIPGSTICVDTRIIDNSPDLDYLVFIYGTDTNNDGTLTGDEIIGLFGRCIWPSASNVSYYQIIDGVLYLIHENNNLNTGETLIFVLNTQTNYLIVKDKNGNTLFQGPATGWSGGGIPQELGK